MKTEHLTIAAGAFCTALTLEVCYIPHRLLDGGMTGMAVIAARLIHLSPVHLLFVLNALFMAIGFRLLGPRFVSRAMVGTLTFGLTLLLIQPLPRLLPGYLATLIGGIGIGVGTALVLRGGGALDGCEVIGQILRSRRQIPLAWSLLAINGIVFTLVVIIYGLEPAFYSVVAQAIAQVTLFLLLPGRHEAGAAGPP